MRTPRHHFITGGAGFIGSHLTETLLEAGDRVTVLDNLSHAQDAWLEGMRGHPGFRFYKGDLLDGEVPADALAGADLVWHLAANTNMVIGAQSTRPDIDNGILATHALLELMRRHGARKLVFASSGAVYGEIARPPASEDYGPLLPLSLYGAAKVAAEAMISSYSHLFGIQAWMFRFGNVLGARMSHGVIYDFFHKLRKNSTELEILGDGLAEKNYILVEEIIDGMLYVVGKASGACEIFNLGSPTTTTVTEIARIVTEAMGLPGVPFRFTGGPRGWPGDQPRVYMDVGKVRALGWQTRCSSTEAVRVAVGRYLEQSGIAAPRPGLAPAVPVEGVLPHTT